MRNTFLIGLILLLFACTYQQNKEIKLPIWEVITLNDSPTEFLIPIDSSNEVRHIDSIYSSAKNWTLDTSHFELLNDLSLAVRTSGDYTLLIISQRNKVTESYLVKNNELLYSFFENDEEPNDQTYYFNGIAFAFRIADSDPEWINEFDCEQFMKADHWNFRKNRIRKLHYVAKNLKE